MSEELVWNFWIAVNLTHSIKQFINLRIGQSTWINGALNDLQWASERNDAERISIMGELGRIFQENNWVISCRAKAMIGLSEQVPLFCANNEIIIVKSLPDRINSLKIEEYRSNYFLIAALSCNGKRLYCWKNKAWCKIELEPLKNYELYYFYYCKITQGVKTSPSQNPGYDKFSALFEETFKLARQVEKVHQKISEESKINSLENEDKVKEEYEMIEEDKEIDSKIQKLQIEADKQATEKEKEKGPKSKKTQNKAIEENKEMNPKSQELQTAVDKQVIGNEKEKVSKSKKTQIKAEEDQVPKLQATIQALGEIIKKFEEESEQSKKTIEKFKNKVEELKKQKKDSEKEIKNKYVSEIEELKNENKSKNETIQQLNKNIQQLHSDQKSQLVGLEKLNHSLVDENNSLREEKRKLEENVINMLPRNRKHGLPNFGNTCYLNSVLQIFSSTPAFEAKLPNFRFSQSLKELLINMKRDNTRRTINDLTKIFSSNLLEAYPHLEAYAQQDPKEILSLILSKILEENNRFNTFSITFEQELICCKKHKSTYTDSNWFLLIPPNYKDYPGSFVLSKINSPSTIKSYCTSSNAEVNTQISVKKYLLPDQFIFYFPVPSQNLKDFITIGNTWYELYGAICYYQDESCHYTAFTKDGEVWNEYNDEHVETKSINPFLVTLAFYSKVSQPSPGKIAPKNSSSNSKR